MAYINQFYSDLHSDTVSDNLKRMPLTLPWNTTHFNSDGTLKDNIKFNSGVMQDLRQHAKAIISNFKSTSKFVEVEVPADVSGSLSGKYWILNSANNTTTYWVWYDVDDGSTAPTPTTETLIEVDISANDDAETVAENTKIAIDAVGDFNARIKGIKEKTEITIPADDTSSLDGKYWQFTDTAGTYWVWYDVAYGTADAPKGYQECGLTSKTGITETGLSASTQYYLKINSTEYDITTLAATSGYQECGIIGKTGSSQTGLSTTTTYYFKVTVDGGSEIEYNITTASDTTYTAIIALLNVETSGLCTWSVNILDFKCTSDTTGISSSISLAAGTTGTDLFTTLTDFSAFDTAVNGTINTFTSLISLLNTETTGLFTWTLEDGDLRCTNDLTGTSSVVFLSAGTTGTDLFATLTDFSAFDTAVDCQTLIEVDISEDDDAATVAFKTYGAVDLFASSTHRLLIAEEDTTKMRLTNSVAGATSDVVDINAGITTSVLWQGVTGIDTVIIENANNGPATGPTDIDAGVSITVLQNGASPDFSRVADSYLETGDFTGNEEFNETNGAINPANAGLLDDMDEGNIETLDGRSLPGAATEGTIITKTKIEEISAKLQAARSYSNYSNHANTGLNEYGDGYMNHGNTHSASSRGIFCHRHHGNHSNAGYQYMNQVKEHINTTYTDTTHSNYANTL